MKSVLMLLALLAAIGHCWLMIDHAGHLFAYRNTLASHDEVANWCQGLGGLLPSVHSPDDVDFLHALMTRAGVSGFVFLAAELENQKWRWLDGSSTDFLTNWTSASCPQEIAVADCTLAVARREGSDKDGTIQTVNRRLAYTHVQLCQLPLE